MTLSQSPGQTCIALRLSLCLVLLLVALTSARAQEMVKIIPKPPDEPAETNVSERVRVLEAELERQNAKLDQLQKTIADQQSALQALLEKLSVKSVSSASSVESPAPATNPQPTQAAPIEQRVAKLESQALRIGPVRVSGDFRLRFDGTWRSATEPPDPPLQHVQNVRARYRFRLNLDTDIHPNLSFHGQLSTGPFNNPLTLDQDFTAVTARAPISINEAWIEYRPKKAVTLQGGRVQEVFADNSRFLFDDDIRFNGFNEKYVAAFKPNDFRLASLEFRAGQYIFTNQIGRASCRERV